MSLGWKWFIEYQTPHSAHMHGIREILHSMKTDYQQIDIVDSEEYGRMLLLDGKVQSTVRDEYFYHECLVHPAMLSHPKPTEVLILGGGEGGALREVLRHPSVRRAVMVDIDEGVVEASKKFMPELSMGAFEDRRAELVIGDGRKYVEGCREKFDVIIMDLTDPLEGGPGALLYTKEFYELAREAMSSRGIIVTQATSTYYSSYCFAAIHNTISKVFKNVGGYHVWVPSYDSMWGFIYGALGRDPNRMSAAEVESELERREIKNLRYLDGRIYEKLFVLPKDLMKEVTECRRIATDEEPTFMPI